MLVLNNEYYDAWQRITDPLVRDWVRRWQDGLHRGTHPEWAFSPISITCLARLWEVFSPSLSPRARSQRKAICVLATRRLGYLDAIRFRCPDGDDETRWEHYWNDVRAEGGEFRQSVFESIRSLLSAPDCEHSLGELPMTMDVLAAELMQWGYTDFELFVRAGGVLDPKQNHPQLPMVRLLGLLDHLERRPVYDFLVWTDIASSEGSISKTTARRLASRELGAVEEWTGSTGFVRLANGLSIVTRCESTHSLTAFLNHRLDAAQRLRARCGQLALTGLRLAESSSVIRPSSRERKVWVHSPPRISVPEVDQPDPGVEPYAFRQAVSLVEDEPQEAIRLLGDAFERALGTEWPKVAGRCYRLRLRGALSRQLAAAVRETQTRERNGLYDQTWWTDVTPVGRLDFGAISKQIMGSVPHSDRLLASRLAAVVDESTRYSTPGTVNGWLYLAKGIRNRVVHVGSWPAELFSTAQFLARVMICAYVSAFPSASMSGAPSTDAASNEAAQE